MYLQKRVVTSTNEYGKKSITKNCNSLLLLVTALEFNQQ
jgi:hypothetical protein